MKKMRAQTGQSVSGIDLFFKCGLAAVAVSIAAEIIMMIVAPFLPPLGTWGTIALRVAAIVSAVIPIVYYWRIRLQQQTSAKIFSITKSTPAADPSSTHYFDQSPYAMVVTDKAGFIHEVNQAFMEMTGFSREDLLTMGINHFLPQNEETPGMDHFRTVTTTGKASVVVPISVKGGSRKYWDIQAVALGNGRFLAYISDVTSRIEAEKELQRNREMLTRTERIAHVGSWEWDVATDTVTWSDEMFRIFKRNPEQKAPSYKELDAFFHPDDMLLLKSCIEKEVHEGVPYTLEMRAIKSDGEQRLCLAHGQAVLDSEGRTIRLVGSFQDFTELRQAEMALQASEERLKEAQRFAQIGSWELNLTTNELSWSDEIFRIFEIDPSQFGASYEAFLNAIHPDDREAVSSAYETSVKNRTPYKIDHRLLMKSGEIKFVQETCATFYDSQGNPLRSVGTVQDITERKHYEEELRESKEQYQAILHAAMDGFWLVDSHGHILEVNDAYCRMSGYSRSELLAMSMPDLEASMSPEIIAERIKKVMEEGTARFETSHYRKDKSVMHVEISAQYQAIGGGRFVSFLRDITETKRLQELESRAQRLDTAGRIAGQVAHDFNNMLAPIMAYPEMIREQLPDGDPGISYLDIIEDSARKISELNQQLLTLSRRGHYNKQVLNLNDVIKAVLRSMTHQPETTLVETNLCPDLMNIKGGAAQVHRVILNLLTNAIDAVRNNGTVSIRTENYYVDEATLIYGRVPRGEYVKLTISDSGHGIPDDIAQKVFDPFFTTKDSDKRRGSGLGLSVVDAVVRDHAGYIDLSTQVGAGTSFYIYFPTTHEDVDKTDNSAVTGGVERVLVVDDDDIQRDVTARILTSLGYQVSRAAGGEQAVEILREHPQDMIVLDMIMPPGIDGTETYRRLLEIHPEMKAVILSGYAQSDRVREAQAMGAGAFVRKPITRRILAEAVRRELDRKVGMPVS